MTTFHRIDGPPPAGAGAGARYVSFTKGATDVLLDRCTNMMTSAGLQPMDAGDIAPVNDRMAAEGLRVLAVGVRFWDTLPDRSVPPERRDRT